MNGQKLVAFSSETLPAPYGIENGPDARVSALFAAYNCPKRLPTSSLAGGVTIFMVFDLLGSQYWQRKEETKVDRFLNF